MKYNKEFYPNRLTRNLIHHAYELLEYGVKFENRRSNGQRLIILEYKKDSDGSDGKMMMPSAKDSTVTTVPVYDKENL